MGYLLSVFIDTDDDAQIRFEGKKYCFYSENLRIHRVFETVEECYSFLKTAIYVEPGFKVSECVDEWIQDFIDSHRLGNDWYGIHGNQTVEISIDSVLPCEAKPPKSPVLVPVRYFHENDAHEIVEITESEFTDDWSDIITYERHTVFANGVDQICLTKWHGH